MKNRSVSTFVKGGGIRKFFSERGRIVVPGTKIIRWKSERKFFDMLARKFLRENVLKGNNRGGKTRGGCGGG
jgi:hypothetical protein